jgi:hypothetical protein
VALRSIITVAVAAVGGSRAGAGAVAAITTAAGLATAAKRISGPLWTAPPSTQRTGTAPRQRAGTAVTAAAEAEAASVAEVEGAEAPTAHPIAPTMATASAVSATESVQKSALTQGQAVGMAAAPLLSDQAAAVAVGTEAVVAPVTTQEAVAAPLT